jgi:hypothetical protein
MQLIGAITTEVINMFLMCSFTKATDVIMNLLAFGIIADIDDLYRATIPPSSIGVQLVTNGKLNFSSQPERKLQINAESE